MPSASLYDPEEAEVLDEYLMHGRAIRAERERADRGRPESRTSSISCARGAA